MFGAWLRGGDTLHSSRLCIFGRVTVHAFLWRYWSEAEGMRVVGSTFGCIYTVIYRVATPLSDMVQSRNVYDLSN